MTLCGGAQRVGGTLALLGAMTSLVSLCACTVRTPRQVMDVLSAAELLDLRTRLGRHHDRARRPRHDRRLPAAVGFLSARVPSAFTAGDCRVRSCVSRICRRQ